MFDGLEDSPCKILAGKTRGLGLLVPADASTIETIINNIRHLITTQGDAIARPRHPPSSKPASVAEVVHVAPSQHDDELPVVWSFYHGGSWKVNWTDKDGKRHSNAVSYVVPDKDEHGKLLEQGA